MITYDPPTQLSTSINVADAAVALTIPPATVNEASKSASASTRACYASSGTCNIAASFVAKMKGTPPTNLPSWLV